MGKESNSQIDSETQQVIQDIQYKTPIKAIRDKCIDCCCGNSVEVKKCSIVKCPLFPYRFGKNPFRKHNIVYTQEQRDACRQRLENYWRKRKGEI